MRRNGGTDCRAAEWFSWMVRIVARVLRLRTGSLQGDITVRFLPFVMLPGPRQASEAILAMSAPPEVTRCRWFLVREREFLSKLYIMGIDGFIEQQSQENFRAARPLLSSPIMAGEFASEREKT